MSRVIRRDNLTVDRLKRLAKELPARGYYLVLDTDATRRLRPGQRQDELGRHLQLRGQDGVDDAFTTRPMWSPMPAPCGRRNATPSTHRRLADWLCLARAGRDGLTSTIRGTYS